MSINKRIQGNYLIENLINPGDPIERGNPEMPASLNPELHETIIKTSFLTIDGDLIVRGDTTVENIDEISIEDPVVLLNSNVDEEDGETINSIPYTLVPEGPTGNKQAVAGIEINLGLTNKEWENEEDDGPKPSRRTNLQLRYNDTNYVNDSNVNTGFWEASDDSVNYYPLNSSLGFKLEDDKDPHLGGDLIVNDFKIKSLINAGDVGNIIIDSANDVIIDATGQVKSETPIGLKVVLTDPPLVPGYNTIYGKAIGSGGTGLYVTNQERTEELVSRSKAIVFGLIF